MRPDRMRNSDSRALTRATEQDQHRDDDERAAGERDLGDGAHGILTVFETRTCSPPNAGTFTPRKIFATQPPSALPAKSPDTSALVARPLLAKVTATFPVPCVPSWEAHSFSARAA